MPTPGSEQEDAVLREIRRIAALEGTGAWEQAVEAWNALVAREPEAPQASLGRAQAQLRAGRAADALADLESLTSNHPSVPAPGSALAHARAMLGRHEEAVAAAERAVSVAPDLLAAHVTLGDVCRQGRRGVEASAAYARAVDLAPENVEALNKLATMRRALGDRRGARILLQQALAIAPHHPYVRVNAGTMALALGHRDEGRALLSSALEDPKLPGDARREAADALAMLEEDAALTPAVQRAVTTHSPSAIASALSGRRRDTDADRTLVAQFDRMVERLSGRSNLTERFARGSPVASAWAAIEAHHHYRETRAREAIADSVAMVGRGGPASSAVERDIEHYAGLVGDCDVVLEKARCHPMDGGDPIEFEALMRWVHARLVWHRPDRRPGCFKLGTLPGSALRGLSRRQPAYTQPTFDVLLRDLLPRLPEGPVRVAFMHVAVVSLQPFNDCNTRVARFLQNRLLVQGGWFPSLRPARGDRILQEQALSTADLEPMIVSLAAGTHEAAERDREWRAMDPADALPRSAHPTRAAAATSDLAALSDGTPTAGPTIR